MKNVGFALVGMPSVVYDAQLIRSVEHVCPLGNFFEERSVTAFKGNPEYLGSEVVLVFQDPFKVNHLGRSTESKGKRKTRKGSTVAYLLLECLVVMLPIDQKCANFGVTVHAIPVTALDCLVEGHSGDVPACLQPDIFAMWRLVEDLQKSGSISQGGHSAIQDIDGSQKASSGQRPVLS